MDHGRREPGRIRGRRDQPPERLDEWPQSRDQAREVGQLPREGAEDSPRDGAARDDSCQLRTSLVELLLGDGHRDFRPREGQVP
eukprot:7632662-Alexandrium_andersonii.AAC.1